jgi:hypothetical protein
MYSKKNFNKFFSLFTQVEFPSDGKLTDDKEVTSWILEQVGFTNSKSFVSLKVVPY